MEQFYPNECALCKVTNPLIRCKACKMVSYCGLLHQKQHRQKHGQFCKTVSVLNLLNGGFLFSHLRDVELSKWNTKRREILSVVQQLLGRPCSPNERQMFFFPRFCFVCYDTRHDNLTNCPGCPNASFCRKHPSSPEHDSDCSTINYIHTLDQESVERTSKDILSIVELAVENTRFNESSNFPASMQELKTHLDLCIKPEVKVPEHLKLYASEHMTNAMTVLNGLRKLNYPPVPELTLHVGGANLTEECSKSWELILHLLPDLMTLKIVIIEGQEVVKLDQKLCDECRSREKKLIVESNCKSRVYIKYMKEKDYQKPDVLVVLNPQHPELNEDMLENWKIILDHWKELNCPIVISAVADRTRGFLSESLRSSFWDSLIIYDGKNNFHSLRPWREWANGRYGYLNQFMIVTKGRDAQDCEEKRVETETQAIPVKLSKSQRRRAAKKAQKEKRVFENTEGKVEKSENLENLKSHPKAGTENQESFAEKVEIEPETEAEISNEKLELELKFAEKNTGLEVKKIATENFISKEEDSSSTEKRLKEYLVLKEENRILKMNFSLKEENKKLELENQELEKENEKLEEENRLIEEIRRQVRESIWAEIKPK
ncbi:uncharacterized protein LOC117173311 isoform X2 [Belonocnema kinseyi]|uniref:uncharacterized protein LOC117173311 isoform X2 n=1 Tax=Belonocnema kinseyi TaxID=2817044 RepID=UPI00143D157F|nr:uncharacterized protein LOC117173311 isoform X2 [Belonocnema kinseyi]